MISLRPPVEKDISALTPLFSQLGYPMQQAEIEARFQAFKGRDDCGALVACDDHDRAKGFIAWSLTPSFLSHKTRIRIEALVIDKNFRGQKIGRKLMHGFEEHAQKYAPAYIELTSGFKREEAGAHRFYKQLGYRNEGKDEKLYVRKEIP